MCKKNNVSNREAIQNICDAVCLKYAASYATDWPNQGKYFRSIPPAVVKEMQLRTAVYAAEKVGLLSDEKDNDKALELARLLSPKVKSNPVGVG